MENLCGNFQIINICCVSKVIKENIKKGHERCFCKLTFLLEITFLGKWLYHLEIFHYNNLTYMESINLSWGIYRTLRVWAKTLWKRVKIHISGVTKCVTKFLTLSKSPHCDSVKNFVTHFVTAEIWTLTQKTLKKIHNFSIWQTVMLMGIWKSNAFLIAYQQ